MARSNRQQQRNPNPPAPPPEEPILMDDSALLADEQALLAALQEMQAAGGGGQVRLYQQGVGGHKDLTFLDDYPLAEFTIKAVQLDYGAGTYRAWVQREDNTLVANRGFKVGPSRTGEPPRSRQPATSAAPGAAPGQLDVRQLLEDQRKQFETLLDRIRPEPAAGLTIKDMVELMAVFQGMKAPAQASPIAALKDLKDAMEVMSELRGEGEGSGSIGGALVRVLERHLPALAQLAKAPPGGAPSEPLPSLPPNGPAPVPGQEGAQQPTEEEMGMLALMTMLTRAAKNDADPTTYAGMVLDEFDGNQVASMVTRPDWHAQLTAFAPALAQFPKWCSELREALIVSLKEDGYINAAGAAVVVDLTTQHPAGTSGANSGAPDAGPGKT